MRRNNIAAAIGGVLCIAGLLWPYWPLSLLGVIVLATGGSMVGALVLGLLLDLMYGVPIGWLHYVCAPFFLCALACICARMLFVRMTRGQMVDRL